MNSNYSISTQRHYETLFLKEKLCVEALHRIIENNASYEKEFGLAKANQMWFEMFQVDCHHISSICHAGVKLIFKTLGLDVPDAYTNIVLDAHNTNDELRCQECISRLRNIVEIFCDWEHAFTLIRDNLKSLRKWVEQEFSSDEKKHILDRYNATIASFKEKPYANDHSFLELMDLFFVIMNPRMAS